MVDTADLKSVASNSVPVQVRPSVPSLNFIGPLAQRLEQGTHNPLVLGSNPRGPTINASLAQSVEQLTFNQLVLGSSPRGCTI